MLYEKNEPFEYDFLPGNYLFELWGASGGGNRPGYGAYVSGILPIREKTTLYMYLGQKGVCGNSISFNGGGEGCIYGSSGGGSTDVRFTKGEWNDFDSLMSRIIVAGGGGGSQCSKDYLSQGGSGGILKGEDGQKRKVSESDIYVARGGEQNKGGDHGKKYVNNANEGTSGGFGFGGNGSIGDSSGNGGGSGYFGGGGSATADSVVGSGAGGSSYISGKNGCIAILENSTSTNLSFSEDSLHYSGFAFWSISVKSGSEIIWDGSGKIHIRCLKTLNLGNSCKINQICHILFIYILCFIK